MGNEKHLAILRKGIEKWNAWLEQHDEVRPNLGGTDLPAALVVPNTSECYACEVSGGPVGQK